jgi:hypothetical protein
MVTKLLTVHYLGTRTVNCQPLPLVSDEACNDLPAIGRDASLQVDSL